MGLAGVRNKDNMALFEDKKPLAVVYFAVDYVRNPKGERFLCTLPVENCYNTLLLQVATTGATGTSRISNTVCSIVSKVHI